jgi:hypothetical protein
MPGWLAWIAGIGLVTAETALLGAAGWYAWSLQTPIALAVLLASHRDFVPGATTLAALLVPLEWLVGTPPGYYGLGLVVVFLSVYGLQRRFRGERSAFDRLAVGMAALIHPVVVALGLAIAAPAESRPDFLSWSVLAGVVALPIVIGPMHAAMKRLDATFDSSADLSM